MQERANEEAKRILATHHPEYVTKKEADEIDKIAHSAQTWIQKNWDQNVH